ncbi:MAG: CAP domain-containing protein [Isosphaeraceae bacterium]
MRSPKIAALAAVLLSVVTLSAFGQDEGQAGPPTPPPATTEGAPESTAAPATGAANYAVPPGATEQWVWLTDQKIWGYGYKLQDGPFKGMWRVRYKAKSPSTAQSAAGSSASPVVQTSYTTTRPAAPAGDPYGFVAILNQMRASSGLPPVAYDANLSAWASQNNAAQNSYGLGHHVNPGSYQNSGWNYANAAAVAQAWLASPGHAAAMLANGISRVGIAYGPGPYWTMNAQ